MPRLKTVELFAGIGGFRLACDAKGFETIWANDLDPKACTVYRARFGHAALREGDIRTLSGEIPDHDLLTGGFPCQPFSSAGKKSGIRDPRGTLFQTIVEIVRAHEPSFFVLENVKRLLSMEDGSHFATILEALASLDYRIEWRVLNAMHFGLPQNRQRVVIVGTHQRALSSRKWDRVLLASSEDLLALSDLERSIFLAGRGRWTAIELHARRFPWWGIALDGRFFGADLLAFTSASQMPSLNSILQDNHDVGPEFDFTDSTKDRLKDNVPVNRFVQGVQILSNQGGGARMGYTIFGVDGVAPTLTAATSRHYERYSIGGRFRRLTNVEYARLQGFPDNHCREISVYDQYVLFGNAVPPPLISWVLDRMRSSGASLPKQRTGQLALFYAS
jgi:DNA (cytosine-5)-methyltransferase 1